MTGRTLAVFCVAGLSGSLLDSGECPGLRAFAERCGRRTIEPVLPAVTLPMQATFTTGRPPSAHGVVGNGYYDRVYQEHRFWTASAGIVDAPRVWQGRPGGPPRVGALFWWNFLGADLAAYLNAAPFHLSDGSTVSSCYSNPPGLYAHLERTLGPFPLHRFWGPGAGIDSSRWILDAALETARLIELDLLLVYLPHLDYSLQRSGPGSAEAERGLRELDALVQPVLDQSAGGTLEVMILSDYGITPVRAPAAPNRALRDAGLFRVRRLGPREYADLPGSRAFAICDHQIAHVYVRDPADQAAVRQRLESLAGVARVLGAAGKRAAGIDHPRSGDLVAVSADDSWFEYRWWDQPEAAPDFARTVDVHRKIGYDPLELIADPRGGGIAGDAGLVRGSHGCIPADDAFRPVIISRFLDESYSGASRPIAAAGVGALMMNVLDCVQRFK